MGWRSRRSYEPTYIYRLRVMLLLGRSRVIGRTCTYREHVEDLAHGIRFLEFAIANHESPWETFKAGPTAVLRDARGVCDDGKRHHAGV